MLQREQLIQTGGWPFYDREKWEKRGTHGSKRTGKNSSETSGADDRAYLAGAGAYLSAGGSDRPVYVPAERTAVSALQPVGLSGLWAGRSRNFGCMVYTGKFCLSDGCDGWDLCERNSFFRVAWTSNAGNAGDSPVSGTVCASSPGCYAFDWRSAA